MSASAQPCWHIIIGIPLHIIMHGMPIDMDCIIMFMRSFIMSI